MAGPCWSSPLPRIRWEPDAVPSNTQLDLFQQLRRAELPLMPATPGVPPASTPGPVSPLKPPAGAVAADDAVLETGVIRVWYVPHERARRYRLMLRADGSARCTIPRRGSLKEARRFVDGARGWLNRQLQRRTAALSGDFQWTAGVAVWFRGQKVPLVIPVRAEGAPLKVQLGGEELSFRLRRSTAQATESGGEGDLRALVEMGLRRVAERELPGRLQELAAQAGISIAGVSVRNQRTRWGSCSRRGIISLNWRLIQTPEFVRDYILLHELAHRRHLDHSERFWGEVARLCPEWEAAEAWIKRYGRELL